MKVIIDIDEDIMSAIKDYNVSPSQVDTICEQILNGTPLNGTNGEVLMKMFPPSVCFPSDGRYIVLLTKDCTVSCHNTDWWNAEYKAESEEE